MSDNLFSSLIDNLFQVPQAVYNLTHKLPSYCEFIPTNDIRIGNSLSIALGETRTNTIYLNINQDRPHTYLVGQTSSGKSNLLKVILATIINNYKDTQLILCDYKRVELSLFKETNSCISFSYTQEDIANTINNTYQMVLDRYDKLANEGKYQASQFDMETILLVIEEISLMDKQTMKVLRNIMAISRAVNVYVLFTCQRVSNECIDNVVKSLVSNRIVLRVEDKKNSIIALDEEGGELLKGNGHGIFKNGYLKTEFQSYLIKDETLFEILKRNTKSTIDKPKMNVTIDNSIEEAQEVGLNSNWVYKDL